MRLQSLTESMTSLDNLPNEDIIKLINRDCIPYLKMLKTPEHILYRGVKEHSKHFFKDTTHLVSRRSDTLSPELHEYLNQVMEDEFGHRYRNALFATGFKHHASAYGEAFICLPIGPVDILYSNVIQDLAEYIYTNLENMGLQKQNMKRIDIIDDISDITDDVMEHGEYHEISKIGNQSPNEHMIWCKSYYMITEGLYDKIMNELYI